MTPEEYAAIPALNFNALKHIAVSPSWFKWNQANPGERTDAFTFGGALHCRVLEPEHFDARYQVYDERRDPRAKAWQEWQAAHPGVETLKTPVMDRVKRCADKVLGDRYAGPLLRGGRREEPLTWVDAQTGIKCKGRLDYIRPELFAELKTTVDPSYSAFQRAIVKYGYNAQCAWYHDGAVAARRIDGRKNPVMIAVRTKGDFDVAVYPLDDGMLAHGRARYRGLLQQLVRCQLADLWPGVAPEPQLMILPPWAESELSFMTEPESEDF